MGGPYSAVSCAKTAKPLEMPFQTWTRVGPMKHVHEGAHWLNLANTVEQSIYGGDAAFCQITLITCCLLQTSS